MPEEVKQETLRPVYKLTRDEIAKVVEDATGQKPNEGFHSVTLTMQMNGESGTMTWVNAANRDNFVAPNTKQIPPVKTKKGKKVTNGDNPANG